MWYKESNGQFPYTKRDLIKDNPNTSFPEKITPEILESYGLKEVQIDRTIPDFNEDTQEIFLGDPERVGSDWVRKHKVRELPIEAKERKQKQKDLKEEETKKELIKEALFEVLLKFVVEGKPIPQDYKKYIKDLQDKPKGSNWPTKPEETK